MYVYIFLLLNRFLCYITIENKSDKSELTDNKISYNSDKQLQKKTLLG